MASSSSKDQLVSTFWDTLSEVTRKALSSEPFSLLVNVCQGSFSQLGVPSTHIPSGDQLALSLTVAGLTLGLYYIAKGEKNSRSRRDLERKLSMAQRTVKDLEDKLFGLEANDIKDKLGGKEVRIWMDGAFDMMHYGHMNAFRQGRALGTYLIVGVNSDESITKCKGAPVMNDEERCEAVRGCKFVDQVVPNVPYIMNEEYLNYVIQKYKIDYVVHGDDPCLVDGRDVYESAQKMGRYLTIPRTEGISTTDIVGRMLLMTKSHHSKSFEDFVEAADTDSDSGELSHFDRRKSSFLTTSRTIKLFGAGVTAPSKSAKVVYLAGSWDMFHTGHIAILRAARAYGDYVIVGVHNDTVTNSNRGMNLPIMNMQERVLSVMACKYVDDVLIDAPYVITSEMIASLKISRVVQGTVSEDVNFSDSPFSGSTIDPYIVPKELGIFISLDSPFDITVLDIVQRIQTQRQRFNAKFTQKKIAEDEYYEKRYASSTLVSASTLLVSNQ